MPQIFKSTQGIILRVISFRENDQILSLFTPDEGLIKVIYKRNQSRRWGGQGHCMPLTQVELVYREKKGEIFQCYEITYLPALLSLRKELLFLNVACDLLQAILSSQLIGKAAPQLYALLSFYLKKIPIITNPWVLAASFRLKILKHDGLIFFPLTCCECSQLLHGEAFTRGGEKWCVVHRPVDSQAWDFTELQTIAGLAACQSYQEMCLYSVSFHLQNKISTFFDACVKR